MYIRQTRLLFFPSELSTSWLKAMTVHLDNNDQLHINRDDLEFSKTVKHLCLLHNEYQMPLGEVPFNATFISSLIGGYSIDSSAELIKKINLARLYQHVKTKRNTGLMVVSDLGAELYKASLPPMNQAATLFRRMPSMEWLTRLYEAGVYGRLIRRGQRFPIPIKIVLLNYAPSNASHESINEYISKFVHQYFQFQKGNVHTLTTTLSKDSTYAEYAYVIEQLHDQQICSWKPGVEHE